MNKKLKIMSLNIGNPSIERARIQAQWIENRSEDVFVLTETKNSKGCNYIAEYFQRNELSFFTMNTENNYYVFFPKSITGDLGVMVISKIPIVSSYSIFDQDNAFFSRFVGCDIDLGESKLHIIGLYVPSRDRSPEKIERKRSFCHYVEKYIENLNEKACIICGDFNILERQHIPHYSTFFEWEYAFYDFFYKNNFFDTFKFCHPNQTEYSWVGRTNDGYRYDYCFANNEIKHNIIESYYLHETREKSFTDHSAIITELTY